MNGEFNSAPNDSPRSGSSKKVAPLALAAMTIAAIAIILWLVMKP